MILLETPTPIYVLSTPPSHTMDGDAKPWVARIRGTSEQYGLARDFVPAHRDYADADTNSRGALRGVVTRFPLRVGWVVECYHRVSHRHKDGWDRYFGLVREDGIEHWTPEATQEWADAQSRRRKER